MADLLTHMLVPYILLTMLGWFLEVPSHWIPVAMGGAAIPDLVKTVSLLDETVIQRVLDLPFSYAPISSLGGVLVIAAGITVAFERDHWTRVYGLLVFGGVTSLVLDGLRVYADGYAGYWLYPLWVRPPTPSLYVTSDSRVLLVALFASGLVTLIDRYR